ncbi:MAG: hypothetical protein GY719_33890 [bacterium]|nr:hypothetical protein [bacterium]
METIFHHPDLWKYVSIPFVAGFVGWGTNWAAIQLTFLPIEFVGRKPYLGWQGIIPSKAERMAGIFVDSTMVKLGTLPELFEQMEPAKIAAQIEKIIIPRLPKYTDEIVLRENPTVWRRTPNVVKQAIYERIREAFPQLVHNLMAEANEHIEELIDFKFMITDRLVHDRALLNRLFLESGDKEFKFIVRSGLYFGFLFGLVQLAVWIFYPAWWVLPAFGLAVGWATNWIALNIIFRPLHPKKLGPWTLQGLFLKRQREVAVSWCSLVTREIVSVRSMIYSMINGPYADNTRALIKKHMEPIVREAMDPLLTQIAVGNDSFEEMRNLVGEKSIAVSTEPFDDWHFNRERGQVVERLLRQRMEELPSEEFQDLLRPCFQEDELLLILVGAALGFLAGLAQLFFVFGGV